MSNLYNIYNRYNELQIWIKDFNISNFQIEKLHQTSVSIFHLSGTVRLRDSYYLKFLMLGSHEMVVKLKICH